MTNYLELLYLISFTGILAVAYSYLLSGQIISSSAGNSRMQEIAEAIQIGAKAYLNRQYKTIAVVGLIVLAIVSYFFSYLVGLGYFIGAFLSGVAGYVGMLISVKANVRTAEAARQSLQSGLTIAFKSGAITGLLVAGLALLSITIYYIILINLNVNNREIINALVALGFGASLISILQDWVEEYLQGADVGADLVGKVEAGIPEDDPRNPAIIADNVGDNVGDCAGMAADLFETYAVTIVATMVLASIFSPQDYNLMIYPLAIGGACIVTSIIGTWFVKLGKNKNIMGALYKGFIVTAITSLLIMYPVTDSIIGMKNTYNNNAGAIFSGFELYICGVVGFIITGLLIWVTEYYTGTDYRPVKTVAKSSTTGHGTNVIQGLAISMEATAIPALIIVAGILYTNSLAGLYGIAIAVTSMLALTGMVVALDAYGPVTDNAGGIAEMSKLPKNVRKTTDALDAVGNTTKAVTKGYAIGSAGLGALVLFAAYTEDIKYFSKVSGSSLEGVNVTFDLSNPFVVAGLLIGGMLPYLFGSMGMQAVGRAGGAVVIEVRRQFKKIPGIMKGKRKPDYGRLVDLLTKAVIKEMIIPSLLPVLSPIVLYFIILQVGGLDLHWLL